jgi:hypothetical protein
VNHPGSRVRYRTPARYFPFCVHQTVQRIEQTLSRFSVLFAVTSS